MCHIHSNCSTGDQLRLCLWPDVAPAYRYEFLERPPARGLNARHFGDPYWVIHKEPMFRFEPAPGGKPGSIFITLLWPDCLHLENHAS